MERVVLICKNILKNKLVHKYATTGELIIWILYDLCLFLAATVTGPL